MAVRIQGYMYLKDIGNYLPWAIAIFLIVFIKSIGCTLMTMALYLQFSMSNFSVRAVTVLYIISNLCITTSLCTVAYCYVQEADFCEELDGPVSERFIDFTLHCLLAFTALLISQTCVLRLLFLCFPLSFRKMKTFEKTSTVLVLVLLFWFSAGFEMMRLFTAEPPNEVQSGRSAYFNHTFFDTVVVANTIVENVVPAGIIFTCVIIRMVYKIHKLCVISHKNSQYRYWRECSLAIAKEDENTSLPKKKNISFSLHAMNNSSSHVDNQIDWTWSTVDFVDEELRDHAARRDSRRTSIRSETNPCWNSIIYNQNRLEMGQGHGSSGSFFTTKEDRSNSLNAVKSCCHSFRAFAFYTLYAIILIVYTCILLREEGEYSDIYPWACLVLHFAHSLAFLFFMPSWGFLVRKIALMPLCMTKRKSSDFTRSTSTSDNFNSPRGTRVG